VDRKIVYDSAIPLSTDLLYPQKNAMIALAELGAALLGSTGGVFSGFGVSPTSPPSLEVVVAPGSVYQLQAVDSAAYGDLAPDTAHAILKQGIALDQTIIPLAAPTTVGQSVNYLIEIGYQDQDTDQTVLPYYNAANPTVTLSGPGGDGAAQATTRKGVAVVQAKAGTAAATGSQTTPAPDSGFLAAYVVTVVYGQTAITSANIAAAPAAPLLAGLLNAHHGGVPGQAPQINLATEVQGLLPAANIAPGALASALPAPATINVTTAGATLTLTALQAASPIIRLTGTLSANLTVVFPANVQNQWAVVNGTIGGFTVTCVTAAGGSAGYVVRQGFTYDLYSDGTNMLPDGQPSFNGTVAVASLSPALQLNEVYWLTS
jgi:hypothetical protein